MTNKIFIRPPLESDDSVSGAIMGVSVFKNETVDWIWTYLSDGRSAVTGYRICDKKIKVGLKEDSSI